jgi:lysophospholipase L1-like esterase
MRRRLTSLFIATLLMGVSIPVSAVEGGGTYLALGDSVAAGTQAPQPFTDHGYTDLLARDLADRYGIDGFVNLACPGEDTVEMRTGAGSLCYDGGPLPPGGVSQLQAAVDYLVAHPGEVRLITITIGANDILACEFDDPDVAACVAAQLGQIAANLPVILGTLRTVAPGVPIIGMNYYNPQVALWLVDPDLATAALALTGPFNGTLEAIYGAFGIPVADVETAFKTLKLEGAVPQNVKAACLYTRMCEKDGPEYVLSDFSSAPGAQPDIHPSDKGYRKIASTFAELIAELGVLGG